MQTKEFHTELLEGNLAYYAGALKQLTITEIWYMSKTDREGVAEPVPITKASLRACDFEPNRTDTCYILEVTPGVDIKVHFEDSNRYNRITFTKNNPTFNNLWYIKEEIALHELQNLSKLMLGHMFNLKTKK